jgi:hypothetical protein
LFKALLVRVRIPIGYREKALLTRNDATGTSQEGNHVLAAEANNFVQRKIVTTGQSQG